MTEKEYAQVIAKNLKRIAFERDKTQAQIAQELKIHRATLSAWMNGTRTPKMLHMRHKTQKRPVQTQ